MGRYSSTRINSRTVRFYDRAATRITEVQEAMSPEQKAYTALNNAFTTNNTTVTVADSTMENVETLKIKLITQKSAEEAFESLKNTAMSKYPNVKLVKIGEQTIEKV